MSTFIRITEEETVAGRRPTTYTLNTEHIVFVRWTYPDFAEIATTIPTVWLKTGDPDSVAALRALEQYS